MLLGRADRFTEGGLDLGTQRRAAAGAVIRQRCGAVLIVVVQPAQHGLRMTAGAVCHLGGADTLRDVVEGQETLAAAGVGRGQGLVAQICLRLVPTLMVDVQHRVC